MFNIFKKRETDHLAQLKALEDSYKIPDKWVIVDDDLQIKKSLIQSYQLLEDKPIPYIKIEVGNVNTKINYYFHLEKGLKYYSLDQLNILFNRGLTLSFFTPFDFNDLMADKTSLETAEIQFKKWCNLTYV